MQTYEIETIKQIWHNQDGWRIEIGPDPDGLDCVEIKERNENNKILGIIRVEKECALLIARAINDLYGDKNVM